MVFSGSPGQEVMSGKNLLDFEFTLVSEETASLNGV
jgi:hypothetical protein